MLYWANINNVKVGPMPPEQLVAYGLTPDTYVWRQGWEQWCKAKFVDELQPWVAPQYGPRDNFGEQTRYWNAGDNRDCSRPPMPSSYLPWALIVTFICCIPVGIVAVIYSSMVESRYAAGNYAGAMKASEAAKWWCIGGAILGAIYYLVVGIFSFLPSMSILWR